MTLTIKPRNIYSSDSKFELNFKKKDPPVCQDGGKELKSMQIKAILFWQTNRFSFTFKDEIRQIRKGFELRRVKNLCNKLGVV